MGPALLQLLPNTTHTSVPLTNKHLITPTHLLCREPDTYDLTAKGKQSKLLLEKVGWLVSMISSIAVP